MALYPRTQALTFPARPSEGQSLSWSPSAVFLIFCLAHLTLWTLVPALMYPCLPNDTMEGIVWGNMWLPGYDKHPPLAAWLSAFFANAFGVPGWPLYLASQLSVVLCFWAIWRLASEMLDPWQALLAVCLLEGIHYYNLSSFTLNPNIVMLPTWALLTLTTYRAVRQPSLWRWAQAGIWAGLALLAKYESGILFLVLLAVFAGTREGRRSLADPRLYAGALVALSIAAPNLIWLAQHDFVSVQYAVGNLHPETARTPLQAVGHRLVQPLEFFFEQFLSVLPAGLLLLMFPLSRPRMDWRDFDRVFVFAVTAGPLLLTLSISVLTGSDLIPRWAFPFFSVIGVALVLFFRPTIDAPRVRRFFLVLAILSSVAVAGLATTIYALPYLTGKPPFFITYPARPLANYVTSRWHQHFGSRLRIVAGDRTRVSGIGAYSPDKPMPYFNWNPQRNPWLSEGQLRSAGAVFVHQLRNPSDDQRLIESLKARFPRLTLEERVTFPQLSNAPLPPVHIWLGYLPPSGWHPAAAAGPSTKSGAGSGTLKGDRH
jgi:4-amino-4-deoxy-L-arabinose transferase-like glycosyltransferase